jgi:hypothetical protein
VAGASQVLAPTCSCLCVRYNKISSTCEVYEHVAHIDTSPLAHKLNQKQLHILVDLNGCAQLRRPSEYPEYPEYPWWAPPVRLPLSRLSLWQQSRLCRAPDASQMAPVPVQMWQG